MSRSMPAVAAQVLLAAAIVLGGGGSSSPWWELALQLVFAAICLVFAAAPLIGISAPPLRPLREVFAIAGLALALPLAQLIPLPPALWQALPGREAEIAALRLVGADTGWMPLSQSPSRTLATLLAMVPPAGLMLLTAQCTLAQRTRLLWVLVAGGAASVVLGALQLADGEGTQWRLQVETHLGWLTGFQANRNAEADVLNIALAATAALGAISLVRMGAGPSRALARAVLGLVFVLILFGAVMTGSRMGIVLLGAVLVAFAATAWLMLRRKGLNLTRSAPWVAAAGLAAIGLVGVALVRVPELGRVADRFLYDGDDRAKLWADTREAIAATWPAGSGLGTFQPVFVASERLEYVDPSVPVRAHNDWLEFTLEAGLAGWIVLAAILAIIILQWRRAVAAVRRDQGESRHVVAAQIGFATIALGVLALHAIVDYPLRSMSLACLAAMATAMLFRPPDPPTVAGSELDTSGTWWHP